MKFLYDIKSSITKIRLSDKQKNTLLYFLTILCIVLGYTSSQAMILTQNFETLLNDYNKVIDQALIEVDRREELVEENDSWKNLFYILQNEELKSYEEFWVKKECVFDGYKQECKNLQNIEIEKYNAKEI